jgi:transposase
MKESKQTKRERPTYSDEFKDDAVLLATTSSRSIAEVARELAIPDLTLRRWIKIKNGKDLSFSQITAEAEEIRRLKRENDELRMEKEILKRFSAFWVKETQKS